MSPHLQSPSGRIAVSGAFAFSMVAVLAVLPVAHAFEGIGYQTVGGVGGDTCHVS